MKKSRVDLRLELVPLFFGILAFALGLIFYAGRAAVLEKSGVDKYGEEWPMILGIAEWGIPALALGAYLLLAFGSWALDRVADPVRDWNALMRGMGRAEVSDPERKEAVRVRLLGLLYLLRVSLQLLALVAQFFYYQYLMNQFGPALP